MLTLRVEIHEATRPDPAGPDGRPILSLSVETGESLVVLGIESRLVQVFRNLIANAVSFSPAGGAINMTIASDSHGLAIAIDDEGPGIPEGKLEAIFDRFYSERPKGEKFGTHSGLGLSISKQIVDAHHGKIHAENRRSADGRTIGARFVVRLPKR
jgi:two-component system sensor histidine kinase ChvG